MDKITAVRIIQPDTENRKRKNMAHRSVLKNITTLDNHTKEVRPSCGNIFPNWGIDR